TSTSQPASSTRPVGTDGRPIAQPAGTDRPTSTTRPTGTGRPTPTTRPMDTDRPTTTTRPADTGHPTSTTRPASSTRPPSATRPPGRLDRSRPADRRDQRRPAVKTVRRRRIKPHELFAERLLAVLSGERPVQWMLKYSAGRGYQQLVELAPLTPLRTRGTRPVVRTCRALPLRPGVVEASACIAAGDQVRAMAFRLEQDTELRWRCTAVELGGERRPAEE
ncbi:Rv3235 family protein, partial [Streptomyces monticola]